MFKSQGFIDVIDKISNAVAVVNYDTNILYHNDRFTKNFSSGASEDFVGCFFYQAIGYPRLISKDYAPFHLAMENNKQTKTTLLYPADSRLAGRQFRMSVEPIVLEQSNEKTLLVEIYEITESYKRELRIEMLRSTGRELSAIVNQSSSASTEETTKKLKDLISHHLSMLKYGVFEIRTYDKETNYLVPFLDLGIADDAQRRQLKRNCSGNGVTGYVAYTRQSYVCNDTKNDPLYIPGAIDAKSSVTVPLMFDSELIGVCNVESPEPDAFTDEDVLFVELYARDLAFAIHQLDFVNEKDTFVRQASSSYLSRELGPHFSMVMQDSAEINAVLRTKNEPIVDTKQLIQLIDNFCIVKKKFHKFTQKLFNVPITILNSTDTDEFPSFSFANEEEKREWNETTKALAGKTFLFIVHDEQILSNHRLWLEKLFCNVDIVHSSKAALFALRNFEYDYVLCELNPDGIYSFPTTPVDSRNIRDLRMCDIHFEGYSAPFSNATDEEAHQRILQEIKDGKLDAYFIFNKYRSFKSNPIFYLFIYPSSPYFINDPTHIRPAVNARREEFEGQSMHPEPFFKVSNKSEKDQRTFFRVFAKTLKFLGRI